MYNQSCYNILQTSYLNKQGGGGGASVHVSYSTPTKYYTPSSSRAIQFQNPITDLDPDEEFGMSDVTLTPTVEARMNKKLVAEASTNRKSSFVLSQIAKHEAYFDEAGIDKNSPTLNNKYNHKFVNR